MAEHRGGSGNFAENPEKASEAGKKGGEHSHGGARKEK
ncbi:KGG domain-containing protein [Pantoea sp. NGS-ED-1003]